MKRNPFGFVLLLSIFLLAAGFFSYSYLLPRYIEKRVFPGLGDHLSSTVTGKVYRIGLNSADLGNIVVGDSRNVAARIGSIHAEYTPASLLAKQLESITLNGLTLNLGLAGDKILVPGIDLERFARTGAAQKEEPPPSEINLPIGLESLEIINGLLNIHYQNRLIPVPFSLRITRQENMGPADLPVYLLELQMSPQGLQTSIAGTMDLAGNTGNLAVAADFFDLDCFGFLLGEMQKILQFGPGSLSGKAKFRIMPFQLDSAELDGELESLHLRNIQVTFGTSGENTGKVVPLRLKVKGQGKQWNIALQGAITEPLSGSLDLKGSLVRDGESLTGSGEILLQTEDALFLTNHSEQQNFMIKGNPELAGSFTFEMGPPGTWQAKLETKNKEKEDIKAEPSRVQFGNNILSVNNLSAVLHGKGSAEFQEILAAVNLSDLHASLNDSAEVKIPKVMLEASVSQKRESGQESLASGSFVVSLPDTQFTNNGLTGKGEIILEGTMPPQVVVNMISLRVAGKLSANNTELEEQSSGLKIKPLDIQIPWHWPLSGQETPGRIKAAQMSWKNNELGSFVAEIGLRDAEYSIVGRHTSSLIKGIVTNVTGNTVIAASGFQGKMLLHTAPTSFTSLHLGMIEPTLKNSYLSGELGLDGAFSYDAKGLLGGLSVSLQKGRFEYPDKKYEVEGISFSLQMPFLPELRSTPAQNILFDRGTFGNLVFEDGKIIWQLESAERLFIEEGVVRWSGGRVFTNAVRISPDRKDFIVPIFCDRLILAEILRQFGITNAEGEGTVSGRVPLLIGKGTVRVDDGFLYSSPGQGGSLKVAAFDLLSAGIPKKTPQFAQVDFAAEALKNFKYNWVKLLLNSEEEDLVMQMQMDGKPLQSLPFTYDTQTGLLQRVEDSSKGIDQPIRLDVNFRLPLNRFLGYSGKIQGILEKIK